MTFMLFMPFMCAFGRDNVATNRDLHTPIVSSIFAVSLWRQRLEAG